MGDTYNLPGYGELVILENFFIFEIYTLVFVAFFLYMGIRKNSISNIIVLAISVLLYKVVTLNLFSGNCCTLQTQYYPSLGELNILIGVITFGNLLGGYVFSKFVPKKFSFTTFILGAYILSIINELLIRVLGLRVYGDSITSLLSKKTILGMNIETYLYIFIGVLLMVSIFGFISSQLNKIPDLKPPKQVHSNIIVSFAVALLGAFLGEILLHPQFIYKNFPSYSYIYQDLNFITLLLLSFAILFSIIFSRYLKSLHKFFGIWYIEWIMSIVLSSFVYTIIYLVLSNSQMFEFVVSGFPIGWNIGGLPVEIIGSIFLINVFSVTFVRNFTK